MPSIAGRGRVPALFLGLALVLAACGGSTEAAGVASLASAEPGAATAEPSGAPVDFQDALLEFTQCLRDQGLDVDDPQFGTGGGPQFGGGGGAGGGLFGGADPNDPGVRAAQEACAPLLEGVQGQFDPEAQAERQAQQLALAQCMRDEGIDWPDPQIGTGAGGGFGGNFRTEVDFQSPEVQAALEVCRTEVGFEGPGGFGGPGGGPGGGGQNGGNGTDGASA
jgi:hypothetical protein